MRKFHDGVTQARKRSGMPVTTRMEMKENRRKKKIIQQQKNVQPME